MILSTTQTAENYSDPGVLQNTRVLIIDDSETNIKVLGSLLRKHNSEVLTASNAISGINIAGAKQPDLILLDIMMPEVDGFEAFSMLAQNERTKEIPVIYLTGLDNTKSLLRGFELGAVDYIRKPYNHRELVARIATRIKQKKEFHEGRALFESRSHSFITIGTDYRITNFNPSANERNMLLKHCNLRVGENVFSYIAESDHKFITRRIDNALKGKQVEFEKHYLVNNQSLWFNYILEPIKNKLGQVTGCLMSGTDITAKKATEIEDAHYLQKINEVFDETQQSIRYASHIQQAIFPNHETINEQFEDSFVLFKPKDKVSGDFYWTYNLGDKTLLLLGDCTGHGVPGALLTTISIVLLERIVKYQEISSPEKILMELNSNFVNILNQKDGGIKDGLEMGICLFDKKTGVVEFAGAKRSLLAVNGKEVLEFKGERQEIGGMGVKSFTKQSFVPAKGSSVYIFSDGFVDQMGGPDNKKYLKKRLRLLMENFNHLPMDEQELSFRNAIETWQGSTEQTDDILLIGVRI